MHVVDHAYSIQSTWWLHRLIIVACVIISPSTFTYYLDLSEYTLESGLSYFRVLTICLLLIYFVSAAGCHCFDFYCVLGLARYFLSHKNLYMAYSGKTSAYFYSNLTKTAWCFIDTSFFAIHFPSCAFLEIFTDRDHILLFLYLSFPLDSTRGAEGRRE